MPKPKSDESRKDFMERCMIDPESVNIFPNVSQRYAVCNSVWTTDRMTSMSKFLDTYNDISTDHPKQANHNEE